MRRNERKVPTGRNRNSQQISRHKIAKELPLEEQIERSKTRIQHFKERAYNFERCRNWMQASRAKANLAIEQEKLEELRARRAGRKLPEEDLKTTAETGKRVKLVVGGQKPNRMMIPQTPSAA